MSEFIVYEVVRVVAYEKWLHTVEAETSDEALAKAKLGGDPEPHHCGELGEPNEVHSGWSVRERVANEHDDPLLGRWLGESVSLHTVESGEPDLVLKASEVGSREPQFLDIGQ